MAAALGADVCEIYTDVEGVFTADPRLVPDARKLTRISYEEMLEMAASGARVLQLRSVEYARRHNVRLRVLPSYTEGEGTWVVEEDEIPMLEQALIRGVALTTDEAKVTLDEVPDRPGVAAAIFKAVAADGINVDMIVQNVSHDGRTDLSFTVPKEDLPRLDAVMGSIVSDIGAVRYTTDDSIAKLSLVGAGMKSSPGVAADMFDALAAESINLDMISTSSIRISCVIRAEDAERAVRTVHRRFELAAELLPTED
jgi:aspartate kinase